MEVSRVCIVAPGPWSHAGNSFHPSALDEYFHDSACNVKRPVNVALLFVPTLPYPKKDAEESHTAVGVHRLAPRPGEPMEIGGRGVLEQTRTGGSGRGRGGEYELVAMREESERQEVSDPSDMAGIRRVVKG